MNGLTKRLCASCRSVPFEWRAKASKPGELCQSRIVRVSTTKIQPPYRLVSCQLVLLLFPYRREFEETSVYLNKSDNATDVLEHNQNVRTALIPDAGKDTTESVQSLLANISHRGADPVIARFRAALLTIQANELKRLYNRLPELDERSRQEIGQFADCLVATILRPPLESLRNETCINSSRRLLDALQRLFQLAD